MATCRGSGMVIIINSKAIGQTNVDQVRKGYPVYVEHLTVDMLTDGCIINLKTGKIDVTNAK